MNRLTERDEYGNADIIGVDSEDLQLNLDFEGFNRVTEALNRLASYEDSGLEPEEVERYAKAEKEGRLLVLPCKVGDELWITRNGKIQCETVDRITVDQTDEDDDLFISIYTMSVSVLAEDIGRLVFLTREDAEKALEGMKNDEC